MKDTIQADYTLGPPNQRVRPAAAQARQCHCRRPECFLRKRPDRSLDGFESTNLSAKAGETFTDNPACIHWVFVCSLPESACQFGRYS